MISGPKTQLDFVVRAVQDAELHLLNIECMRLTECDAGEVLTEENSFKPDYATVIRALNVAQRLLGWKPGLGPEQLERQFGSRGAIEATGDADLIAAFERWDSSRRERQ
jgi:hypothetical protein